MTKPATAFAQAVEALRETARDHKRLSASHRKAARDAMRRAAFLERLSEIGIQVPEGGDTDGTRDS
jgi:RIO-like serine/threonine protein kinase